MYYIHNGDMRKVTAVNSLYVTLDNGVRVADEAPIFYDRMFTSIIQIAPNTFPTDGTFQVMQTFQLSHITSILQRVELYKVDMVWNGHIVQAVGTMSIAGYDVHYLML